MKYCSFTLLSVWILLLLLCCSVWRGWDQNRSSEASLIGQTATDAVHSARPEEIHQVSLHLYYPVTAISSHLSVFLLVVQLLAPCISYTSHYISRILLLVSLMPVSVIVNQNFMLHPLSSVCLSLFSECLLIFSAFCCLILFCLCLFFPLPCLSFLLFSPSILLSIPTCGLCRFIIVKTDLSGSQRPVLNHTATSFILLH